MSLDKRIKNLIREVKREVFETGIGELKPRYSIMEVINVVEENRITGKFKVKYDGDKNYDSERQQQILENSLYNPNINTFYKIDIKREEGLVRISVSVMLAYRAIEPQMGDTARKIIEQLNADNRLKSYGRFEYGQEEIRLRCPGKFANYNLPFAICNFVIIDEKMQEGTYDPKSHSEPLKRLCKEKIKETILAISQSLNEIQY